MPLPPPTTDAWGIDASYLDAHGDRQDVDPEVIATLRSIIGRPDREATHPVVLRPGESVAIGPGVLALEDGTIRDVARDLGDVPLGYHRFTCIEGTEVPVISAPARCFEPDGPRRWGWAAQLYATRSRSSWGIGDLADLRRLTTWSAAQGAGFALINPLGAVAPAGPQEPSPYSPASRRFRNPLYLCVEEVPGAAEAAEVVARAATAGRLLDDDRAIDRDAAWALKQRALEAIWNATTDLERFDAWYRDQPADLTAYATWAVLVEQHGPDWHAWPEGLRHPDGDDVAATRAAHGDRVRFHAWLQWNLEVQLAAAGRPLALVQDLPIGVGPDGFDAWAWQDVLAPGVTVGAPPDELNTQGQDWGLPPFDPWRLRAAGYQPFIDTIRASMAEGGGLRIDHVMGLFRLWWVPAGGTAADGAFVRYPAGDLLAIVALESHRARAVVVGEDLGTVEQEARRLLAEHRVLSYQVLWFEDDEPEAWPEGAMAAVSTHDLPTVAGLWTGEDLAEQEDLGLRPNHESTRHLRDRLAVGTGLDDEAPPERAVVAAHRLLARAPARMVVATLDDACAEPRRPNVPGAPPARGNWCLALPHPLEDLEQLPLTAAVTAALQETGAAAPTRRGGGVPGGRAAIG